MKTCSCGKVWTAVPRDREVKVVPDITEEGPQDFAGSYWNCDCGSTLYQPTESVELLSKVAP
jgi:hypothetical protein